MYEPYILLDNILIKPEHNQVIREGETLTIEPLAMAVLKMLVAHKGRVVSSKELLAQLWQGKVVSDNALHRIVGQIRKALGDNALAPKYIRTVKKIGYELLADVQIKDVSSRTNLPKDRAWYIFALFMVLIAMAVIVVFTSQMVDKSPISAEKNLLKIRQLTSFPGVERDPVFWPQQQSVIFTYQPNGELYNNIMARQMKTGDYYLLTDDYFHYVRLAISPDQKKIAYVRRDDKNCFIEVAELRENTMLTGVKQLSACPFISSNYLSWSNDSGSIIYSKNGYSFRQSELMLFNIASGTESPLLSSKPGEAADYYPVMEPNGSHLAFIRALSDTYQLKMYDLKSAQEKLLWESEDKKSVIRIAWLKDKSSIVLQFGANLKLLNLNGDIANIAHNLTKRIRNIQVNSQNQLLIAVEEYENQISEFQLPAEIEPPIKEHAIGRVIEESSKSEFNGFYSNNKNSITFLSNRESDDYRLWESTNNAAKLVMPDAMIFTSRWSEDDQRLLFISPQQQLYVYDRVKQQRRLLLDKSNSVMSLNWSSRPNIIYICQLVQGTHQIFSLNIDSLVKAPFTEQGGCFMKESADARYLYFNKFNENGLWRYDFENEQHVLVIPEFSQMNRGHWQLFDDGIYFIRNREDRRGLFYYDFSSKSTRMVIDNKEFGHFDVAPDHSRVLISEKKKLVGDLYLADIE
ncbi:winged helix-turn-helix domain-containing protein [Thalassotalea fusca]